MNTADLVSAANAAKPGFMTLFAAHPILVVVAALVVLAIAAAVVALNPDLISQFLGGDASDQGY